MAEKPPILDDAGMTRSPLTVALRLTLITALSLFASARPAHAQSTEAALAARLVRQPLYLRGAWGENKLRFDISGQPLQPYRLVPFTLAAIDVRKVRLDDQRLYIEGTRVGLIFNAEGSATRVALAWRRHQEIIHLEIDGPSGADFSPAVDAIFARDISKVPSACDGPWQVYARTHWPCAADAPSAPDDSSSASSGHPLKAGGSVQPPRLLQQTAPKFNEMARAMQHSGVVQVGVQVEPDGTVSHLRIAKPAGLGLDEQAIAAVSTYRFAPATQNETPVAVEIFVQVSFQIF